MAAFVCQLNKSLLTYLLVNVTCPYRRSRTAIFCRKVTTLLATIYDQSVPIYLRNHFQISYTDIHGSTLIEKQAASP